METGQLIQRLAERSGSVRRLASPWIRTAVWFAVAFPFVAVVVILMSLRDDLGARMSDAPFVIEQTAALLTSITAAMAAFALTVPGYSRKLALVPLAPLAVWLGSLGRGCVADWVRMGADGLALRPDWVCFPAIVLVGAAPAVAMAVMLRRGAPLSPHLTAALGGLAAAGLGNFGLRLFHVQDASVMILVWQVGTVFALSMLAAWAGGYLLAWRDLIDNARRQAA